MTAIDIHAHSSISDGTDTPAELVGLARRMNLTGVGITDHDTFAGWEAATRAAKEQGVILLRGVELSTSYEGRSVHLLAFLPDPNHEQLNATMERIRQSRNNRLRLMTEQLGADYPRITWQRLTENEPDNDIPWGRPHLADLLISEGYVTDRDEAFRTLLGPSGPYFVHQWAPHPAEMVETVKAAGGVPVLAHPISKHRQRPLPETVIAQMTDAGLFGLERDHREHDKVARQRVQELAGKYQLVTTGGSDYHGTGKPNRLGENTTPLALVEQIAELGTTPLVGI